MKEKVFSDWYHQTRDITARAGFDAAWQHQQAKVEELQKRVDAALKLMQKPLIVGEPAKYVCARFTEIEQALKGGES